MKVELIYDYDCPNVSAARAQLKRAFSQAGLRPDWLEWERSAPECPDYTRGYGSPTILVDGKDVEGAQPANGGASCRIYRSASGATQIAPSVETIAASLRAVAFHEPAVCSPGFSRSEPSEEGTANQEAEVPGRPAPAHGSGIVTTPRAGWRGLLAALPGVGATLLPVGACPACWPAYAGLLGSAGLGFLFQRAWLLPLTVGFLGLALVALGYRAGSRRGYGPLVLGLIGAGLAVGFKFFIDFPPFVYLGLGLVIGTSIWNSWPIKSKSQGSCPACAPAGAASLETKHAHQTKG